MAIYLTKRILSAAAVMAVVSFVVFALLNTIPGDAAQVLVGETASDQQLAELRQMMGLDQPLVVRYLTFVGNALLRGDLGESLISGRPVAELVVARFGYTVVLALAAMTLAVIVGGLAGAAAAMRPGGYFDLTVMGFTVFGQSLPSFWVALLLLMVFGVRLQWLPVVGSGSPAHLVMPVIALALPTTAVVARLVRASLLDVCRADYVCTAHAKGLERWRVWRRHISPNAVIPVLTLLGLHLGHLLGGTFIIETIFGWPGLGRLVVQAIFDRDFPVVVGAVLLIALIYQAINLAVDLAHARLDPRVGKEAL